ncbi:MAG: hypothetical protein HKP10_02200 [Kiritimatiellales bacterium]|nr:hypothetical protein [Kiritimatiellales bacterium]
MDAGKKKNLVLLAVSAVALASVNLLAWVATAKGAIPPVDNMALWSSFVAIHVVSILWATSMLGLQPLVVALSYTAGGVLAFRGVANGAGAGVVEMTTAGATCGAFGVLILGHAVEKVRLAFFNRRQILFMFIMLSLLLADALLITTTASDGRAGLLKAIAIPFAVAGIPVALLWSLRIRLGFGDSSGAQGAGAGSMPADAQAGESDSDSPLFQIPELQGNADVSESTLTAATLESTVEVEAPELELVAEVEPDADKTEQVSDSDHDHDLLFFPLAIDSAEDRSATRAAEDGADLRPALDKIA